MPNTRVEQLRSDIAELGQARAWARAIDRHMSDAELLAAVVLAMERALRALEAADAMGLDLVDAATALPLCDRVLIAAAEHRGLFALAGSRCPQPPAADEDTPKENAG